jgi:predicted DNA binding CopG/RHH family protein
MADDNKIIAELIVAGKDKFVNDLLSAGKAADNTTASVAKMEAQLKDLPSGTKEFEKLKNEIEATKIVTEEATGAFDNNKRRLAEMKKEVSGLATIMATLKSEGKQNTDTFRQIEQRFNETKKAAGELTDKISDINDEIKNLGSDTRGIDNVVRGVSLVANGFQLAQGFTAAFGKENKELEKALLKLNGVMAITQSLQQIGAELTREDSIVKQAAAKATAFYSLVVGESTGALKLFRIALAATGIGLIVIAIGELVANWDKFSQTVRDSFPALDGVIKFFENFRQYAAGTINGIAAGFKGLGKVFSDIFKGNFSNAFSDAKKIGGMMAESFNKGYDKKDKQLKLEAGLSDRKDKLDLLEAQGKDVRAARIKLLQDELSLLEKGSHEYNAKLIEIEKLRTDIRKDGAKKQIKEIEYINQQQLTAIQFGEEAIKSMKDELLNLYTSAKENGIVPESDPNIRALIRNIKDAELQLESFKIGFENLSKDTDVNLKVDENALAGLKEKKAPLTLWEQLFGTYEENQDAQKRTLNYAKGSKKIIDDLVGYGTQISQIASQAIDIQTQNQLALLDERKNKGLISEKEYEKESAKIKNEAARKKRAIDIANAVAQIPQAVLAAFISGMEVGGPIVAGILAGVAGAFGAAQVALIASAPLPKFRQGGSVAKKLGLMRGARHEQGGIPIEVEGGEYVMNTKAVKTYGVKLMDDINSLKFNPVLAGNNIRKQSNNRLNEQLATIGSYLRDGYNTDRKGNQILQEINQKLGKSKVYV